MSCSVMTKSFRDAILGINKELCLDLNIPNQFAQMIRMQLLADRFIPSPTQIYQEIYSAVWGLVRPWLKLPEFNLGI